MGRPNTVVRSAALIAIAAGLQLVAVALFLRDWFPLDERAWAIAATVVAGVAGTIVMFRRDSLGRALIWFASLAIVTLLIIYDVLDALIDPFMEADWPIIVVAIVLVAGLGVLLIALISDDDQQ